MSRAILCLTGCVGWLAVTGPGGTSAAATLDGARLDGLERAAVGQPLPPGWDVRPVRGSSVPESEVVADTAVDRAIRFEAAGQAAFFLRPLDRTLDPQGGRLRWSWRVDRSVAGADLRVPELDDSPARFFVVFGTRGLLSRPRIIFYTWGNRETPGAHWPSFVDGRMHVVVLRTAADPLGEWVEEERDPGSDFRAAFGREPGRVSAIGFMIDTDDTGRSAVGVLGPVRWEAQ